MAFCPLQGLASSSWKLLELVKYLMYHWLIMVYLQPTTCNSILEMVNVIIKNNYHMSSMRYHMKAPIVP